MRLNRLFSVAMLSFLFGVSASAQQPYGGCWHPEHIKNWSPETDKNAKFNRSKVPLAKRFKEPTLMKANANQFYEGQVCNATILFPTCSSCPSQGANNFLGYQPTYWQYMDKLVYWAGSASEGIIIPPPAPSTDAAHQSGVKSLGQIFFPPYAFGGNQAWVREMLTKENGSYIFAKKLYEIAKYMGFDGWFINQESGGSSSSEWAEFIKEFNAIADADGNTHMEIQWYNASGNPNTTILKSHKNTSQFLEYGNNGDYRGQASSLGCTEAETFSKIYAGIQVVSSGHTGFGYYLNQSMPVTGHVGSIDLFCPEERIWKDNVKNLLGKDDTGPSAYAAIQKTFKNEEMMWVNQEGDPTVTSTTSWPGISNRVLERSAITNMPFVSSFCVGVGKHRFVEGKLEGTQDWYHSGVQSIMPTWRWWIENKGNLSASINWEEAYNYGSSIEVSGSLTTGDHLMRLYKTMIPVTAGGTLRLVYKTTTPGTVEMKLATESSTTPDVTLNDATVTEKNGWTIADYDLATLNGKTIYMIALNMKSETEVPYYQLKLGELAVLPAGYAPESVNVENLASTTTLGAEKSDVRLTWDYTYNDDFDHFDIYKKHEDGERTLVGQTRGEAFYVPTFVRNGVDNYLEMEVVPVMKDMKQQPAKSIKLAYPKATAPVVTFSLGKSYLEVGESTSITAKGTGNPAAWEWILPEGLDFKPGTPTNEETVQVVAKKPGKMNVTVKVTNVVGTSTTTKQVIDVIAKEDAALVYNVVKGKKVVDFSNSTNATETPHKIIDGVTNPYETSGKWCTLQSDRWVIFDCLSVYRMYGFRIYDGNSGPESGVDQINNYKIQLSNDGVNWTTVVDAENRVKESIKTDYIPPYKARYVKLIPEANGTLRIWEFEVYGAEDNNMTISVPSSEMKMNAGETQNIVVTYDLNGDARADQFSCRVKNTSGLKVGTITENQANSTFTIPVTAGMKMGVEKLTITVDNGGSYKERIVNISIDSNTQPNILTGATAEIRHYTGDYGFGVTFDKFDIPGLTDGDKATDALQVIETPSTHKDDAWAIFTAPEGKSWNLSKVAIHIPNNNKGTNDNDEAGIVNKEISIAVGNDINNLTRVKTFSDLGEVSELEYILPDFEETKYIAVICNLNPYFYPSLAEVEAYEQFAAAMPAVAPVALKGWNADVIAEAKPASAHTSAILDHQGWVFYTSGVQQEGAIAAGDGIITTKNGTTFQLADYESHNALVIKDLFNPHPLEFETPERCEEIYILMVSANGQAAVATSVTYDDNTSGNGEVFAPKDWFSDSPEGNEAVYGLGRIMTKNESPYVSDQIDERYKFRLYEFTMKTDKEKKIKKINFQNNRWGGVYPTILGVSRKGTGVASGIENIENRPSASAVNGIYTINGMKINTLQKGINIIKMADGTTRKVVIK